MTIPCPYKAGLTLLKQNSISAYYLISSNPEIRRFSETKALTELNIAKIRVQR